MLSYSHCRQYLLFIVLNFSLVACGGGGSEDTTETKKTTPIVVDVVDDGNDLVSDDSEEDTTKVIPVTSLVLKVDGDTELSILESVDLAVSVEGDDNVEVTWSVTNLPTGLSFDEEKLTVTGQLTWQHINQSLAFIINASGGNSNANKVISLTLNEATLSNTEAFRFLTQATFGATDESIAQVSALGINAWIKQQIALDSPYFSLPEDQTTEALAGTNLGILKLIMSQWASDDVNYSLDTQTFNQEGSYYQILMAQSAATQELFLTSQEQLRHRMAYALSQILVVSEVESPLGRRAEALSYYYDILAKHAFSNYGDLLKAVAKSPAMGVYLSNNGNQRTQEDSNNRPDENFAREIMQLFSIGLVELNSDGSIKVDENANPIPTYDQNDIQELARSLTGWSVDNDTKFGSVSNSRGEYMKPMVDWDSEKSDSKGLLYHDSESKHYLGVQVASGLTATQELDILIDTLLAHNNIAPFISKKLIQHFVTSNPSADYIARVASIFNDNGEGEKGDLAAVISAILLDDEARNTQFYQQASFGKLKETFLQYTQLQRAYNAYPAKGWQNKNGEPVMSGVYTDLRVERDFKQGPLRASSVFNFYSPTYAPIDSDFKEGGLVLPELEISTGQDLIKATNRLRATIQNSTFSESDILLEHPTRTITSKLILLDFSPQVAIFQQVLGDNYELFSDETLNEEGRTPLQQAIWLYLVDSDERLMGYSMSDKYYELMFNYLDNLPYGNPETRINRTILYSMHLLMSTNQFKVLK